MRAHSVIVEKCRGRIQVQGDDVDENDPRLSWSWAQATPVTAAAAIDALNQLQAECSRQAAKCREIYFKKARRYVEHCQRLGGVDGPILPRTFQHPCPPAKSGCPTNARVDIEVPAGKAFT